MGKAQPVKTEKEIKAQIAKLAKDYRHVLTGELSTIIENAPRALMQLQAETRLETLNWILGKEYKSKLKPRN